MTHITISLPQDQKDKLKKLYSFYGYNSESELIRELLRKWFIEVENNEPTK